MDREDEDAKSLALELAKVADRLLRNAFKQAGDADETKNYPILAREVKRLVGADRWEWSPVTAVTQVVSAAIGFIPEKFTGRNPERQKQDYGNNGYRGKSERDVAKILYGYRDQDLPARELDDRSKAPHSYEGSYLPAAAKLLGHEKDSRSAKLAFRVVRQDLACAILNMQSDDDINLQLGDVPAAEDRRAPWPTPDSVYGLAYEGGFVLCVIGTRAKLPAAMVDDRKFVGSIFSRLRRLAQLNITRSVISPVIDVSIYFADLLAVDIGDRFPVTPHLWQPASALDVGVATATALTHLQSKGIRSFAIIGVGLTDEEAEALRSLKERTASLQHLAIFTNDPEQDPARFLENVCELAVRDRLIFMCEHVDFEDEYSIADIFAGRGVRPGVVKTGYWPGLSKEGDWRLSARTPYHIRGLSGTGKTARAYYLAYCANEDQTYYLDLRTAESIGSSELRALLDWLEQRSSDGILILDNIQVALNQVDEITDTLIGRPDPKIKLILLETISYNSIHQLGGADREALRLQDGAWIEQRWGLIDWVRENTNLRQEPLDAGENATAIWQFFYLLRGGSKALDRELANARANDHSDVTFFAVSAAAMFFDRRVDFGDLFDLIDRLYLWPLTVAVNARGEWLLGSVIGLVQARQIVLTSIGLAPRHPLEAAAVIRTCCGAASRFTTSSFRDAALVLFRECLPQIQVDSAWIAVADDLAKLEPNSPKYVAGESVYIGKTEIKKFSRTILGPAVDRQLHLERAMTADERVQGHVDYVWSQVRVLIESWPPYLLYHLLAFKNMRATEFRFSPFRSVRQLRCLDLMNGLPGDLMDIRSTVWALVGLNVIQNLQTMWYCGYMYRDLLERHGGDTVIRGIADSYARLAYDERLESAPAFWNLDESAANAASDANQYAAGLTAAWLKRSSSTLSLACDRFDTNAIIQKLQQLKDESSRDILFFSLWLLMPQRTFRAFVECPANLRRALISAFRTGSTTANTEGRYGAGERTFAAFVVALAKLTGEVDLDDWAKMDDADENVLLRQHIKSYMFLWDRPEMVWLGVPSDIPT